MITAVPSRLASDCSIANISFAVAASRLPVGSSVLGGREFAEPVMELIDKAELAIAHQTAAHLVELVEALAFDLDFSRRRLVEPA